MYSTQRSQQNLRTASKKTPILSRKLSVTKSISLSDFSVVQDSKTEKIVDKRKKKKEKKNESVGTLDKRGKKISGTIDRQSQISRSLQDLTSIFGEIRNKWQDIQSLEALNQSPESGAIPETETGAKSGNSNSKNSKAKEEKSRKENREPLKPSIRIYQKNPNGTPGATKKSVAGFYETIANRYFGQSHQSAQDLRLRKLQLQPQGPAAAVQEIFVDNFDVDKKTKENSGHKVKKCLKKCFEIIFLFRFRYQEPKSSK